MKRLLSLLLALVMIFSLCACSDSGGSDKDSDDEKDENEEVEYPIDADFELNGMPYVLTIEDEKNIRFSVDRGELTEDDLDMDEDVSVILVMHLVGTYKERKGVYTATLDTCKYSLEIKSGNKSAVKEALLEYFEDEDYIDDYEDLVNGKEIDMTEEMDYPGGVIACELDGDEIERFVVYEEDGETIDMEYTFHSNGKVKKEIEYYDGEPSYYYEYNKQGELIDEGSMESGGNEPTPAPPNTTAPTYPPEISTMPTAPMPTEPVEQQYYSVTIWVSEMIVDLTYDQIQRFNETNEYGIYIDAVVEGVSEADAASKVISDVWAAPDLYCFAQDQTARLVNAGALSLLDDDAAEYVWGEHDMASADAAYVGGDYWAYPMTSDNGYFMYYDKSIVSDPDNLEAIIADCEASGMYFSFELENAWYNASFFFATGCESQWEVDENGQFVAVYDTFNSDNGLIAVRGMQKLLQSSCYTNSLNFSDSAAVVSGIWNYEVARAEYGSNLGIADLPSFTVDGWAYHLSSFHGSKLLGIKPQSDYGKEYALHLLAQYLTGKDCQLERYEYVAWGPSHVHAQMDPAVQSNLALKALYDQAVYAVPQGQIHGSWWDIAKLITQQVQGGTSPEEALAQYQEAIDNLFGMDEDILNAWTVIGNVSGTNWDTDFEMKMQADGTWKTVELLYFESNTEFKVRQGKSWDVNYGADGQLNGPNVAFGAGGWYYVVFDPWTGYIWLEQ